jgi:hypothetical protein
MTTATTKSTENLLQNALDRGGRKLGVMAWWNADETKVSVPAFTTAWANAGLDTALLPPTKTARATLAEAGNAVVRAAAPGTLFRFADEVNGSYIFGLVEEASDGNGHLHHRQVAQVAVDANGGLSTDSPGNPVVDAIRARFGEEFGIYKVEEVTAAIKKLLDAHHRVNLRRAGPPYFVPEAGRNFEALAAGIAQAVKVISPAWEFVWMPVTDDTTGQTAAALASQARHSFDDEVKDLAKEIDGFVMAVVNDTSTGKPRETTIHERIATLDRLAGQVDLFTDLLAMKADDLTAAITEAKEKAKLLLDAVA